MAKLHSYYTLCPLIDQQNLLGVESDSESGCAIVTLGRNIVIRYKLQDPKQLSSWTSKDRLTTQVVYDRSTEKYVAIFNENKIRLWSDEESDLSNVKGQKFQTRLHTILTTEGSIPVLVRWDGATASLEWALQNRKSWLDRGILISGEKILDCRLIHAIGNTSLCLLTKLKDTCYCVVVKLKEETRQAEMDCLQRVELRRRSEELVGHAVMQGKNNAYLLTLWSHGRLYSHSLTIDTSLSSSSSSPTSSSSSSSPGDAGSSALIGVISNINTKHPVVMTPLNDSTVAVYGADVSEEGAILMIYNVQFKLVQAVQKLKLYTKDAKLWKIEDKLLLAANRHLAIAPYHLAPQKIATLLGSFLRFKRKDQEMDQDEVVVIEESTVAQWEQNSQSLPSIEKRPVPAKLSKQLSSYMSEGLSDAAIQEILLPRLIESKDVAAIAWSLESLKDLPEKILIDLLAFSLSCSEETFISAQFGNAPTDETHCLTNGTYARNNFLDIIFSTAYPDASLSSYLKMGLNFDQVLRLLNYLIERMAADQERSLESYDLHQPNAKQLYEWSCLLLDSHYQHYVLSRDSQVSSLLRKFDAVLEDHIKLFRDLKNLRAILSRTVDGKSPKFSSKDRNKFYAIEEIKLY